MSEREKGEGEGCAAQRCRGRTRTRNLIGSGRTGGSRMIHKAKEKKRREGERQRGRCHSVVNSQILSSFFLSLTDKKRKLRHSAVAEIITRK